MDHLAILRPSSGALKKIVDGSKTIESRWYMTRRAPWGKIAAGDIVYFKYSGRPVEAKGRVQKVLQCDLSLIDVADLLRLYGKEIGLDPATLPAFARAVSCKRYCILVFLTSAQKTSPFQINKAGYGSATAWMTIPDIQELRKY
jgi:hypothetical protein